MSPATWPRDTPLSDRLLRIGTRTATYEDACVRDLPGLLRSGDLLVVNDAATLPASLPAVADGPGGQPIEVRLAGQRAPFDDAGSGPGPNPGDDRWEAVLFGEGDWRTPTEKRPPPPLLAAGAVITFGADLAATVEEVSPLSPRLVGLRFDRRGAALWAALYRHGAPIQYAYLRGPLRLWLVQTPYGSRPWASELPSAGRPLQGSMLLELSRRGVRTASLTHAAGLSSTGDPVLDAALPWPERFEIPAETVRLVHETRRAGGRVIAVGTSVVRALEGSAARNGGALAAGGGVTDLRIQPGFRLQVADGLLTGLHEPSASHFHLLQAFVPEPLLQAAYAHAAARGYLYHEFGDFNLILPE